MTEATQEQEAPISLHLPTQEAKRTETPAFHGSGLSLPMVYRLFLTVRTKEKKKKDKNYTLPFAFSFPLDLGQLEQIGKLFRITLPTSEI